MNCKKKLEINEIIKTFSLHNFNIIENTYNPKTYNLKCKCPNGHILQTNYYRWQENINKCKLCSIKPLKPNKIDIIFLKNEFKKYNCELVSGEYIGYDIPLKYKCSKNHTTEMSYHVWKKNKYKCKECGKLASGNKQKLSYEFVKQEFEKRGYKLLSTEYINKKSKLDFKCPEKHIGKMSFDSFHYAKCICAECAGSKKHTINDIKLILQKESYKLISTEYKNNKEKLKMECENNHLIDLRLNDFISGYRCKICVETIGERVISKFLKNSNIIETFESEYKFNDCKNTKQLPFDFYVDNKFLIEYDGEQHFKPIAFFGGDNGLKNRQLNDKIKTDYCRKNKIALLRISYKQINKIDSIISKFLKDIIENESLIFFSDEKLYEYLNNKTN
jgi:hypothetical protein